MGVTREELYQQVWAEPMIKVAARYEVSSNYLARVCECILNVPRPPRGFWAKLSVGKAPKRPSLPAARPGEVLKWAKGDPVPDPPRSQSSVDAKATDAAAKPWSARRQERHELIAGSASPSSPGVSLRRDTCARSSGTSWTCSCRSPR